MVTWHDRYNLGDDRPSDDSATWMRDLAAELVNAEDAELIPDDHVRAILDKHVVMLPLYLMDHSGLSMSVGGFSCPWDSGQVGYIYCTLKDARVNWMNADAQWDTVLTDHENKPITMREYTDRVLRGEVETYDQDLRGDVYGFVLETGETSETGGGVEWEQGDSCFGFYGTDPAENGMMDHIGDAVTLDQVREAFNNIEYI